MAEPSQESPRRLSVALHWVGIFAAIPILVGVVSADVVLRYGFNAPLLWGNEVSSLILMIVFLASLPLCTKHNAHVRMELVYDRFGRRGRRVADTISGLCGLIFSAFLAYQAVLSAIEAYGFGDGAEFAAIPYWPLLGFMATCALILCGLFLQQMWAAAFRPHNDATR